jgi:hypothetical protein
MRLTHGASRLLVTQGVNEADALRHAEHKVESGDGAELLLFGPPVSGFWIDPFDRDRGLLGMPAQLLVAERVVPAN